jgi:colicin import membrane protein
MKAVSLVFAAWLLLPVSPLLADPAQEADWQMRLERVAAMQEEAEQREKAATVEFEQQNLHCQKKFLVNACVDKARQIHVTETRAIRALRIEASDLERAVKREQLAARDAQAAAERAEREQSLPERQRLRAEDVQVVERERQQRLDEKAIKAEEGARRKAEREAAHQRKLDEHVARVAEREARAAAKAARE